MEKVIKLIFSDKSKSALRGKTKCLIFKTVAKWREMCLISDRGLLIICTEVTDGDRKCMSKG